MILGNRRYRIIYVALAGMDIACLLPYVLTWIERGRLWGEFPLTPVASAVIDRPFALFVFWWLLNIVYLIIADLVNRRQIVSPQREVHFVLLVLGTSLVGVRLLLYPVSPVGDRAWLGDTMRAVVDFSDGVTPPLLFLLVNTFVWLRVAMVADRELSFFSVGVSFRLAMLISILGGALLSTIGGRPTGEALLFFALCFGFGLIAIALARIDEKAIADTIGAGTVVPLTRLAEITALTALIFAVAFAVQRILNPATVRAGVSVLDPVWRALAWGLTTILLAVFLVVGPLLERIMLALERMASDVEPLEAEIAPPLPLDYAGVEQVLRDFTVLRYCFVAFAVIAVVAVLWFFFLRPEDEGTAAPDTEEVEMAEAHTLIRPGPPNLDRLREWLNLLRRYGANRHLLNAISVQNMYANLSRLARRRGYPRLPAQPPDAYIPQLANAFPGQTDRLERLTGAYMRVHYGDLPVEEDELRILRADYECITETLPPAQTEK